jgi:atypical dual specificity phosphatase
VRFTHDQLRAPGDAPLRPFEHCYWLLPGQVLAGEHPGARGSAALMAQRLRTLEACGIGCIIDLTRPAEPLPRYLPMAAHRLSFPVHDFGVPSPDLMRSVLDAMAKALDAGQGVYLHCRAGIGRTGTVAGCWLVDQGLDADEALALLQRKFHAAPQGRSGRPTPETEAQRAFVAAWPRGQARVRSA